MSASKLYVHAFDACYAPVHDFGMHDVPKLIKSLLDRMEINQTDLAQRLSTRKLKITQPQVSRWLRHQAPEGPTYARIVEFAEEQGILGDVRSEDVAGALPGQPAPRTVKVKGYVGAGSQAHFYAVADEDFEEVQAPDGATDQTIAVQIRGKSWGPAMDGWLVFYDEIRSPITPDLFGKPCVVGLADDRILLKLIAREADGSYSLLSNSSEEPIRNVEIEWAALVTSMRPR